MLLVSVCSRLLYGRIVLAQIELTSLSLSILVTYQQVRQTVSEIYFVLCCAVFVKGVTIRPVLVYRKNNAFTIYGRPA